jgi:solute carrier family 8 (sodium/calcium exchanger)
LPKKSSWSSQPLLLGKFPAGNILLSFAILCAGASVKKVLLVLKHINILVYNESTYYYHQKHLLIPTIVTFWRKYQRNVLDQLNGVEVALAGDGRHDSMGHSAKYGTYTIFCCTIGLIINIVLIQVQCISCILFLSLIKLLDSIKVYLTPETIVSVLILQEVNS